jgi:glycosyltransferase involved in cell wall biosynthesis
LHGRLDIPDLAPVYQEFADQPVVSISDSQRAPLPAARWLGTVYHGLPRDLYTLREKPGEYLAFLGRISPEKGVHHAIEIALRSGHELRIAAKVDPKDQGYFETVVKPLLEKSGGRARFIGEVGREQKDAFLGNALALLFPIEWPEPFGLVMIEAMACGTPTIAFPQGSVPEVMENGVTGYIVKSVEEAVEAVEKARTLNRLDCRQAFEQRFSVERMARDYLEIYRRLMQGRLEKKISARVLKEARHGRWSTGCEAEETTARGVLAD